MQRTITAALLVCLLLGALVVPAASAQGYTMVTYTVQPGDTLAKIAQKYCTTWQEIYNLNQAVIGPDPNVLKPGTVLVVPNRCGTSSGIYDRGPSMYANGTVTGNVYTVAAGDTWYSIGQRFGLPWETISAANGDGGLYPGRQLIIPGLASTSPPPAPPPGQSTYLTMTTPAPGSLLGPSFTVSGTGAGLPEGNVVVTAKDSTGRILAQKATTLQGNNVGTGGAGTYSTVLNVSVTSNTSGAVEATSPGVQAVAANSVTFSGSGSSAPNVVYYSPGQCTIVGAPGGPMYAYPGGPQTSYFVAGGPVEAKQRTVYAGMDWYMIQPEASMGNPPMWVPVSSLASVGSGCS